MIFSKFLAIVILLVSGALSAQGCNGSSGASNAFSSTTTQDLVLGVHTMELPDGTKIGTQANAYTNLLRGEFVALTADVIVHEMNVTVSQPLKSMQFIDDDGYEVATDTTSGQTFSLQGRTGSLMRIADANAVQEFRLRVDASDLTKDTDVLVTITQLVVSSAARPSRIVVPMNITTTVRLEVPPRPMISAVATSFAYSYWGTDDVVAEFTITETGLNPSKLTELWVSFSQTNKAPLNTRLIDENGNSIATAQTWSDETNAYFQVGSLTFQPGQSRTFRVVCDTWNSYWISGVLETKVSSALLWSEVNAQASWANLSTTFTSTFF